MIVGARLRSARFPDHAEQAIALIEACSDELPEALLLADDNLDFARTRREVKWWYGVRACLIYTEDADLWN